VNDQESINKSDSNGDVQTTLDKAPWFRSMRARLCIIMSISSLVPIIALHLLSIRFNLLPGNQAIFWYLILVPIIGVINWILSGFIVQPFKELLQSTTKLADMDLRKRLEIIPGEPAETLELRQSFNRLINRLEESLNIQCQFVADASHELRTPLTSIQGYTKLLLRRGGTIDTNLLGEALQTISDESGRLIRLVSDLLQLARADAGQPIIDQQELIDLREVVRSVEDTVSIIAPEQLEIHFISPSLPVLVFADGDKLKQVLLNLTNNAIKATQAGGKVTVVLRAVDNEAILKVIDSGIGIAPADQQRIFDRFYRVERSRTRMRTRHYGGGTGLGLAIAMTIIKAHGGTIELESELNKGSTFTVRLPLAMQDWPYSIDLPPDRQAIKAIDKSMSPEE